MTTGESLPMEIVTRLGIDENNLYDAYCIVLVNDDNSRAIKEVAEEIRKGGKIALVTDPPYGVRLTRQYASHSRGRMADSNDYPNMIGDDHPFNPREVFSGIIGAKSATSVLFGADHYMRHLPDGSLHVWDKIDGLKTTKREVGICDGNDCEFIWSSRAGPSRIFRHRWMGMMKASEQREKRIHPTQKPVALMRQLLAYFVPDRDTMIFDPYFGSGATALACLEMGYPFLGVEIERQYFEGASRRVAQALTKLPFLS